MNERIFALMTNDGVVIDAVPESSARFYVIRADGITFSHAMVPETAKMTADEALKSWNEEPGLYTFEGENPFPQHVEAMVAAFPQHAEAIRATVTKRPARPTYRLWVNAERTVMVELWDSGTMTVATREGTEYTWGPPVTVAEEQVR